MGANEALPLLAQHERPVGALEDDQKMPPWLHPNVGVKRAMAVVEASGCRGAFMVVGPGRGTGTYLLVVNVEGQARAYDVDHGLRGYNLRGAELEFSELANLVRHYGRGQPDPPLPCRLTFGIEYGRLDRGQP